MTLTTIHARWNGTDPDHTTRDADPRWRADAACKDTDPGLFFPEHDKKAEAAAKAVCARCPSEARCLAYALTAGEDDGIWGGSTAAERRRINHKAAS